MIVNSMVYRSGCAGKAVDIEDISEIIQETDAFIWLGLWQPEPAFMYKLQEELIPKPLRAYLRDVQDHARHVVTDVNDMRELLSSAMHVNLALVSVQQNEVAGWGAILVIPTVIFSMYGMNFENMPELKSLYGYPATVIATLGACVFLWQRLKRAVWL